MSTAENQGQPGQGNPSAGGQEHYIPKHRFDEITARLREVEERERIKDQLLTQSVNAQRQQQPQNDEPVINPEELGVDPSVAQAAARIAKTLVNHELQKAQRQTMGMVGQLGSQLEQTKFLLNYGRDKGDYLPQIQERQRRYAQETNGQYMDVETAYKLVRFDEIERASQRRSDPAPQQPQAPAQAAPAPAAQPQNSGPNAALTRQQTSPAVAPAASGFADLSVDEMEARLDEAFRSGQTV